jgi:hypothetical protein
MALHFQNFDPIVCCWHGMMLVLLNGGRLGVRK